MSRKTLRLPVDNEWNNLPKTKAEAIKLGLNRFLPEDGVLRIIRNFGSKQYPNGRPEKAPTRKGSRGAGLEGTRAKTEAFTTPPNADRKAYLNATAAANAQGMDADHVYDISRTAGGIHFKITSGRGTAQEYFDNMEAAGIAVGNQADNIVPRPKNINQQVKPSETRIVDDAIARAGTEPDSIFSAIRGAVRININRAINGSIGKINGAVYNNGNGKNGNGYPRKLNGGAPVGTNTPGSFNDPAVATGSVFEDQNPLFDFVKNSEFGGGTPKDTPYGRGV